MCSGAMMLHRQTRQTYIVFASGLKTFGADHLALNYNLPVYCAHSTNRLGSYLRDYAVCTRRLFTATTTRVSRTSALGAVFELAYKSINPARKARSQSI